MPAPERLPLSLYVHLPWCLRKCPYCDFNSFEAGGALPEGSYVAALLRDLDAELERREQRKLATIFIGGGTPSLFSAAGIAALLEGVEARIAMDPDAEITLEANPGSVETGRFEGYRAAGVNRLSLGVQSFRDSVLAALGRVHDAAEAVSAVRAAVAAGFDNVNIDLMYGLPGDDFTGALRDLERGIALEPAHLSWYQLTLEPNTAFHRRPPPLPDEDRVVEIERAGRELLAAAGFERYEVSAYARNGWRARHNLNYWQFGDYIGIGAGAHGKLTRAEHGRIERRAKLRNPASYMQRAGTDACVEVELVTAPEQIMLEFMMNGLRLTDGIGFDLLEQRTGQTAQSLDDTLAEARRRGWLQDRDDRLQPTAAGLQSLNRLLALF